MILWAASTAFPYHVAILLTATNGFPNHVRESTRCLVINYFFKYSVFEWQTNNDHYWTKDLCRCPLRGMAGRSGCSCPGYFPEPNRSLLIIVVAGACFQGPCVVAAFKTCWTWDSEACDEHFPCGKLTRRLVRICACRKGILSRLERSSSFCMRSNRSAASS